MLVDLIFTGAGSSPSSLGYVRHFDHFGRCIILEDELSNAVSGADHKSAAQVCIDQDHLELTGIIWVNNSREDIYAVLDG
jgi:hypothetical protein